MKQALCLASLIAVLFGTPVLWADEPPEMQLEFVKKLRARKMAGLALEYLQLLQKNPPAELAGILPLEMARTKVSLAQEKDPTQRLALFDEARKDLQVFLAKAGAKPESAQVRLELARLTTLQGQALLSRAFREADEDAGKDFAKRAEQQFIQARTELDEAGKAIDKLQQTYKNPNPDQEKLYKKQLGSDLVEARFERAKTFLDQGRTYLDTDKTEIRTKRAALNDEGRKALEAIVNDDEINPEAAYMAWAWLIRTNYLLQDPNKADTYYNRITKTTSKEAEPARRWARLFRMQGVYEDPSLKPPPGKIKVQWVQDLASAWLKEFPAAKNSPEGYAVRYELGAALYKEASGIEAKAKEKGADKKTLEKKAHGIFEESRKVFSGIAESDSDLSEKANQLTLDISLRLIGDDAPLNRLKDFNEAFLKARVEMARLQETTKNLASAPNPEKKKELEETRKKNLKSLAAAFRRALELTTPKTPPTKIEEARFYLAYVYLMSGDPYRAAVMGEHLVQDHPSGKRAPLAAGYAMQAYLSILNKDRAVNKDKATESKEPLQRLLSFILNDRAKDWKSEPVYAQARYQMALQYMGDEKFPRYKEAIDELEKVPTDFSAYFYTRCQMGLTALAASRNLQEEADKAAYRARGVQILRQFNKLPAGTDVATAIMFAEAQIQLAQLSYEDATNDLIAAIKDQGDPKTKAEGDKKLLQAVKQYQELIAATLDVDKQLKATPDFTADLQQKYMPTFKDFRAYGRLGQANCDYQGNNYASVLKQLEGVVEAVIKPNDYRPANPKFAINVLALQLRACVWSGDMKAAETTLTHLQTMKDSAGEVVDTSNAQRAILGELQLKIKDLRRDKDQTKLKATVKNFSSFIDLLMKGGGGKNLARNDILFLGNCYASLDLHGKSAELFGQLKPPPPLKEDAKDEAKKAFEKDEQGYWFMRVLYGQQLRLAALQPRTPNDPEETKKLQKDAKKVLEEVLAAPKAAGKMVAQKELIHLKQDLGLYGTCITEWSQFMQNPGLQGPLRKGDGKAKELYFETLFHFIECQHRYSQSPKAKGTPSEEKYLRGAADWIVRLELLPPVGDSEGWRLIRDRVQELLANEPLLNQMYERLKKEKTAK